MNYQYKIILSKEGARIVLIEKYLNDRQKDILFESFFKIIGHRETLENNEKVEVLEIKFTPKNFSIEAIAFLCKLGMRESEVGGIIKYLMNNLLREEKEKQEKKKKNNEDKKNKN